MEHEKMNELTYQGSDANLNYVEGPKNGQPLLLVHGNMGRWQAFSSIIPELASNMHVFALDLRGHGKSSHVPGTYTLQSHLLDVTAFIKEKIRSPVILFGMSLGGMVGLMAGARYPELISGIVIADSPLTLETLRPIIESQRDLGHHIIHYLKTNQIDKLYQEINDDFSAESMCACDPDVIVGTFDRYEEMVFGYDLEKLLPLIKCPVLIMRGEEELGSMITDNDMHKAKELLPQLEQLKITGVGHSLLMNKEIVLETVMQFIKFD
jgi:pimeloyl-ACP methyl ester carboxylesterase